MTEEPVVIRAPRMWDGVGAHTTRPVTIVVVADVITEVGSDVSIPSRARTVELDGHTVLPGLIDAHVHTAARPVEGSPNAGTTVSRHVIGAVPALKALLDNGFTTVRDLGGPVGEPFAVALRDAVAAGVLPGPAMVVAPHIISSHAGHGDKSIGLPSGQSVELGAVADGADHVLTQVREEVRAGADWIKFAASGGFTSEGDGPEDVTYTQREMDALVAGARDFNRPCAVHAIGDEAVRRAAAAGVRSVEHASLASAETLSMLRRRGTFVVPTVYVVTYYLGQLDNDEFWRSYPPEIRQQLDRYADPMRQAMRRLARSDIRVAFGTDAGMFRYEDNWREFVAMVDMGFSPARALAAATGVAADLLALPDRGRIRPGARADLVAVPGDPLDDMTVMGQVDFIMRAGCVLRQPR
jgi:imidazolonepropionase-like amidohydrolase